MPTNATAPYSHQLPGQAKSGVNLTVFDEVTNRLRDEPCVSFVLACDGCFDCCPELDVGIRLLSIAARNRLVDHGRLIWGLQEHFVTPSTIASGKDAIRECVGLLQRSGLPFEFLAHVEGESKIEIQFSSDEDSWQLLQIAEGLAEDVRCLAS
jgi:hypothetical protein